MVSAAGALGLLKQAVVDDAGTLRLGWWKGNDRLVERRTAIAFSPDDASASRVLMLPQQPDVSRGLILEGRLLLPPTPFAPRRGIYVECVGDRGSGVLFDAQGRVEFCQTNPAGSICEVEKRSDREMIFGEPALLRLVLEHSLMEVYLDDTLIECFSLPTRATGRIGLILGGDRHAVSDLVAVTCKDVARP